MKTRSNRKIIKKIARKNKRAEKLIQRGKYNRAMSLMLEALMIIEETIGTTNIALAKQHIKLTRFRIKEAKRTQYEIMLQLCNAEIDRVKLSQSFAGRLVLRKLSKRENHGARVLRCSELFGLLHIAEAAFHADRALEIVQQSPNGHHQLFQDASYLANKLYQFFDVPYVLTDPSNRCNAPFNRADYRSEPYLTKKNKGRENIPAFMPHSNSAYVESTQTG